MSSAEPHQKMRSYGGFNACDHNNTGSKKFQKQHETKKELYLD